MRSWFWLCEVARSLGGRTFCSVSPARYAGSSLTCAERPTAQAPYPFTASGFGVKCVSTARRASNTKQLPW